MIAERVACLTVKEFNRLFANGLYERYDPNEDVSFDEPVDTGVADGDQYVVRASGMVDCVGKFGIVYAQYYIQTARRQLSADQIMAIVRPPQEEAPAAAPVVIDPARVEVHGPAGTSAFMRTQQFWDCECAEAYIHGEAVARCGICGCTREDRPDSRLAEVLAQGLATMTPGGEQRGAKRIREILDAKRNLVAVAVNKIKEAVGEAGGPVDLDEADGAVQGSDVVLLRATPEGTIVYRYDLDSDEHEVEITDFDDVAAVALVVVEHAAAAARKKGTA
jgi:hypothetical protein